MHGWAMNQLQGPPWSSRVSGAAGGKVQGLWVRVPREAGQGNKGLFVPSGP